MRNKLRKNEKRVLIVLLAGILLSGLILAVLFAGKRQEIRQKAAASTILSFSPSSVSAKTGDTLRFDINIDPGANLVSAMDLEINFDATKFENVSFSPNTSAFPTTFSGPTVSGGTLTTTIAIGADPTKVIQAPSRVGTLTLTAISGSTAPTQITFGPGTTVLSLAPQDSPSENVLSTTNPADVTITGPTPTPAPTETPAPTATETPAPTATTTLTPSPTPTVTPLPGSTLINLDLILPGVNFDCNVSTTCERVGTAAPIHTTRDVSLEVFDEINNLAFQTTSPIIFDQTTGHFLGSTNLGSSFTSGNYTVKVKTNKYLRRLISGGIQQIISGQVNNLTPSYLVVGDVDNNNLLDIRDFNIIRDCVSVDNLPNTDPAAKFNSLECQSHPERFDTDFEDTGIINLNDLNLFIRSLGTQKGE